MPNSPATDLITIVDVYGKRCRVRRADLDNQAKTLIRMYGKNGYPTYYNSPPQFSRGKALAIHRDNIASVKR